MIINITAIRCGSEWEGGNSSGIFSFPISKNTNEMLKPCVSDNIQSQLVLQKHAHTSSISDKFGLFERKCEIWKSISTKKRFSVREASPAHTHDANIHSQFNNNHLSTDDSWRYGANWFSIMRLRACLSNAKYKIV